MKHYYKLLFTAGSSVYITGCPVHYGWWMCELHFLDLHRTSKEPTTSMKGETDRAVHCEQYCGEMQFRYNDI